MQGMNRKTNHHHRTTWMTAGVCLLILAAGCMEHDYKAEADRDVYNIIDHQWQDSFGTKANYHISDTEPLPQDIRMDKNLPALGVLTLPQAVGLATAFNRDYQTQKETLYRQALNQRLTRHDFENLYFGGLAAVYERDDDNGVLGLEANAGFNRLLEDGTRIGARVTTAWFDILTGNLQGGMSSLLSATFVKPLLRGSSRDVVLENLTQAERDTLYQIRTFNRYRKTFVVSVITQYYRTLRLLQEANYAKAYQQALTDLRDRTEVLVRSGRIPKLELDRIDQTVLQVHDEYLQAQAAYERALDQFKLTLSIKGTTPLTLDSKELDALNASQMVLPAFSEHEVISAALSRRLDLANVSGRVIDAQRKVAVAKDQLRAQLDLVGQADVLSSPDDGRFGLRSADTTYNLGLQLDLPFDRVAESTTYRNAQIDLQAQQRAYEQATDEITLAIRDDYRALTEAAERHRVNTDALTLSEKRLADAQVLLKHSRVSTRRVLQALSDLYEAKNADTQALVDYAVALLAFYRDTGILNVRPDGMWKL